ncbi:MAG: hypothetical protein JW904_02570 [Spirochaetales bacterium]|nr:hypothetical protein [Spirochaetales bacterium]
MAKKTDNDDLEFLGETENLEDEILSPGENTAGAGEDSLDKYGVWVKVEPEDVEGVEPMEEKDMELEDLSFEEEQADTDEDSLSLDGDFDDIDNESEDLSSLSDMEEETVSLDDGEAETESLNGLDDLEISEEESLESFSLDEEPLTETEAEFEDVASDEAAEESFEESSMPEFEDENLEEIELDEVEDTSFDSGGESMGEPTGDFEEISLDDLGIELSEEEPVESTKPKREISASSEIKTGEVAIDELDDDFPALELDLDNSPGDEEELGDLTFSDSEEMELLDIETEESGSVASDLSSEPDDSMTLSSADEGLSDFEDLEDTESLDSFEELPELENEAGESVIPDELSLEEEMISLEDEEIEVPLSDETTIVELEDDMDSIDGKIQDISGGMSMESEGAPSSSILEKIESELQSIKTELSDLKKELGTLRSKTSKTDSSKSDDDDAASFFEEEEDETIALTGEELDNILTTADIKEEEKDESEEGVPSLDSGSDLDLQDDIISYEEDMDEPMALDMDDESAAPDMPITLGDDELSLDGDISPAGSSSDDDEIEIEIPEFDDQNTEADGGDISLEPDIADSEELSIDSGLVDGLEEPEDVLESFSDDDIGSLDLDDSSGVEPLDLGTTEQASGYTPGSRRGESSIPSGLKEEIKSVLSYMDQLLEALPEEKIEEFAKSEYFSIYKKLFEELGLVS